MRRAHHSMTNSNLLGPDKLPQKNNQSHFCVYFTGHWLINEKQMRYEVNAVLELITLRASCTYR